jgi:Kef-type K+ transport system membrane component KefB
VPALLLAGIAPTSAPAATFDVIRENHATSQLAKMLLRVVAVDDAFGILLFSLLLAAAEAIVGERGATTAILWGLWDVTGAIVLGLFLGQPMAWLTGRLRKGEPAILEAAGFVFLCGGLATLLHVSYLLACMVLGAVVANRAKHHTRPFHAIEGAADPFLSVFFVLAGFRLEFVALASLGLLGIVYVFARSAGLILGGHLGARIVGAPAIVQKHLGWCLLPQAGVALGLALLAAERLPEVGEQLLPLIIASTVVFEIVGPIITRHRLRLASKIEQDPT